MEMLKQLIVFLCQYITKNMAIRLKIKVSPKHDFLVFWFLKAIQFTRLQRKCRNRGVGVTEIGLII